jgi:DNA-binding response OmpR family regulator
MTARQKILLVEDEAPLSMIIKDLLESRNFQVTCVDDGAEAYTVYLTFKPDILLLDVMLPGNSGLYIARKIRLEDRQTPILFLTARSMPGDVLDGFEAGGNDYLKKPFDMEELVVRIKVLLNQNRLLEPEDAELTTTRVAIGEYQYDMLKQTLMHRGAIRQLTGREAETLKILYQFRNRLLTRKYFLTQIWGDDDFFSSRSLDVYITKLRRYLKADPMVQIINQRGFGYKLIC